MEEEYDEYFLEDDIDTQPPRVGMPLNEMSTNRQTVYKRRFIYLPTAITAPLLAWATTQIWIPIISKLNVCTTVE